MAKLGHNPSQPFLHWYLSASHPRLDSFSSQELSNLINFLAKTTTPRPPKSYLSSFTKAAYHRLNEFSGVGLATMIHGYGRIGYDPGGMFMDAFFRCLSRQLAKGDFSFLGLALVMNGLGNLRYHPGDSALKMLSESCHLLVSSCTWPTMALILNGMAILDYQPPEIFWSQCLGSLPTGPPPLPELSSILFSLAAMDSPSSRHLLRRLLPYTTPLIHHDLHQAQAQAKGLESSRFRQLSQVALYLKLRKDHHPLSSEEEGFVDLVMTKAMPLVAWNDTAFVSKLHLDVAQKLEGITGLPCQLEVPHHHSVFLLDIVLPPPPSTTTTTTMKKKPVVIEVDGPTHFLANQGHHPTGITRFKRAILAAEVGEVWGAAISVSYIEWAARRKEGLGSESFFVEKFREHGIDLERDFVVRGEKGSGGGGEEEEEEEETDFTALSVGELKALLKARGLTISGTKNELVQRLLESVTADSMRSSSDGGGTTGSSSSSSTTTTSLGGSGISVSSHHHHHHHHHHSQPSWLQEEGILAMVDGGMRSGNHLVGSATDEMVVASSTTSRSSSPPLTSPTTAIPVEGDSAHSEGSVSSLFLTDPELVAAKIVHSLRNGAKTIII